MIFAEAEGESLHDRCNMLIVRLDLNKADAKRQAYAKTAAIIFGPPNPDY